MCGPNSAIGLVDAERELWPLLRDRLRRPGLLMGLMRGVLGEDAEVAAIVATTPEGRSNPVALLVTPAIADELTILDEPSPNAPDDPHLRRGKVGDYDVEVIMSEDADNPGPLALQVSPWMTEHLYLYARDLWHRYKREQRRQD